MSKLFISLFLLTLTIAGLISISRYYNNKIDDTQQLTIAQIDQLMNENPTASGSKSEKEFTFDVNDNEYNIEEDESFKFLNE